MNKQDLTRFRISRLPRPALGGVIAVAVAVGFIVWLVMRNDAGSSTPKRTALAAASTSSKPALPIGPVAVTATGLRRVVAALGKPVYWAGPESGRTYGFTRTSKGDVFVRYLPPGIQADEQKRFLTVGTYLYPRAFADTQALAKKPGAASRRLADGGLAYYRRNHPVSVYLVYPNLGYEIEVFDPSPGEARQLVWSGRIRPVR